MAKFTGKAVVHMAMRMEEVGQAFYEALAEGCDNPQVASLCRRLARVEAGHYTRFKAIYDIAHKPGVDVPLTEEQELRGEELVRSQVVPSPEAVRKVAMGGRLRDALALAVKMEADSIAFYTAILPLVPLAHAPEVQRIIEEEKTHLRDLRLQGG